MALLIDILLISSIQENVSSHLAHGDLSNLSKINSEYRAVLHRVRIGSSNQEIRRSLYSGQHGSPYWRRLKAKGLWVCSESHHVQGTVVRDCRMCSMPVCEACVIKVSFRKHNEGTFATRCRSLCPDCYNSGNTHGGRFSRDAHSSHSLPNLIHPYCSCTAKDGHLCLECKKKQESEAKTHVDQCHGNGCSVMKVMGFPSRVCLWCGLRILGDSNRASARRDYNSRHLFARFHSTYRRRSDDHIQEDVTGDSLVAPQKSVAEPFASDPLERERQKELDEISTRRSLTASAAEDARWARSEALRRPDAKLSSPSIIRRRTTNSIKQSTDWRDTDSTAPTLVNEEPVKDTRRRATMLLRKRRNL